jgi:SEC-C motif-containing protein
MEHVGQPCPCGSALPLSDCCLPYLDGQAKAPSAEALMRSRYTAYALGRVPYIVATTHPAIFPPPDAKGIADWCKAARFVRLEILEAKAGGPPDELGFVRFIAWFTERGKLQALQERSRFERVDGAWAYHSGVHHATKMPGANDPCPCGSGAKYKKCHGA